MAKGEDANNQMIVLRFGTGFDKEQPIFFSEFAGFLIGDVTLSFQIALVSNKKDYRAGIGQVSGVR